MADRITADQIEEVARKGSKSERCGLLFLLASERREEERMREEMDRSASPESRHA